MFVAGAMVIILVVAIVTSNILPGWGNVLLIIFLIAILAGIARGKY
jgi:hypothetical protein